MKILLLLLCVLSGLSACTPAASGPVASPLRSNTSQQKQAEKDQALKNQLAEILNQLEPQIQEYAAVSELTLEHALQLAEDTANTSFRLQSDYQPLPPSALSQRLLRSGIYTSDNLVNAYLSDGNPAHLLSRFREQAQSAMGRTPFTHYGLAVVQRGQSWFVSLILLTELIALEPLPLEYPEPTQATVRGRLLQAGYTSPQVLMTLPNGEVVDLPIQVKGQDFEVRLPLTQSGFYSFEVDLQGPYGPMPACNFVLTVGHDYPLPLETRAPIQTLPSDKNQVRQTLLELVNRDRVAHGLKALTLDSALNEAAQVHSEDMVNTGFLGHNSPNHGTPQEQAARFNITDLVAQNISVSRSLANAQQELMSSPGHRRTLLDPDHTHVGFGVYPGQGGFLYVTQKFLQRQLMLEPLPKQLRAGQVFEVRGQRLEPGYVAVFVDNQVQGEPVDLTQKTHFQIPVSLNQLGAQRLRIGFSPPPHNNVFNFSFYNIWDLDVQP